jgi:hypothetical protein
MARACYAWARVGPLVMLLAGQLAQVVAIPREVEQGGRNGAAAPERISS